MEKAETIFGTRAVIEAIKAGREIEKIYIQSGLNNDLIKELINTAATHKAPYSFIPQVKLDRLSNKNHQGVVCVLSAVQYVPLENIIDKCYSEGREPFFLIVDRVTDVRNFGALARTAECAQVDAMIIADKGNAPITGDAMKTSAGALNHLPVCRVKDMKKTFQLLKDNGIQIIACTEKATNTIYQIDLNTPVAIILGSEEDGISPQMLKDADHLAKIPLMGSIESLNVSVAAGIVVYEKIRQRDYK
ncbi:MAG: 23S rRNA (guanosine(2251)-2'-O)-methyltransferase RlmB [Cytophagales bacterium]|jgi:23S rRNA (guanosine2251-2'-O)-methyltransferase|nr:23S rRNA (guanosine(2251)-2'-O)-methyltransferase RlmB [Cytophagales bacterium]MCA6365756.1 23S rRNA (guanosine(2251)-2'-O)-methyltransferase RlmB [Cytophagales bacterium]MCA6372874.1 23S rRNA (guanosine(2251)-2'-O)-methyltransferase RlmB [Cytophagales bacterium]MCA6376095.1 23S rRNA (guanosine(2251)-2'-O)-methyltransferase RlmB [Cytophagales bacterium]MCA6384149.1 23S rRNA (guanosine(2251)-2'-O)-methyltransferase RlmB [Cytophagales bacterium]